MLLSEDLFGEMIYSYTRAQAIADGELVDVSVMAKQSGFKFPVAVTRALWDSYIEWTGEDTERQTIQDQAGRLWDVLWMLSMACRRNEEPVIQYALYVVPRDGVSRKPTKIYLKAVIGGGDDGAPVITIMLPNED